MILVDPRDGSRELRVLLSGHGVPVAESTQEMPAGDFSFEGLGANGGRCFVGVERKALPDMLKSIRTGRLSGRQIPMMIEMYNYQYVIIEGIFRPGPDDLIEVPYRGSWVPLTLGSCRFMYQELMGYVFTLEQMTPVKFHWTSNMNETAAHILSLYRWWNSKSFDRHRAHESVAADHVETWNKWPLIRRVAKEFPKIGAESSKAVADHFGSIRRMINATAEEWAEIQVPNGKKTRRLGDKAAQDIVSGIDS